MDINLQKILMCPNCSSTALRYSTETIFCPSCQQAYAASGNGIIDFILTESRNSETFRFYEQEYLTKHPDLDVKNSAWKAEEVLKLVKKGGLRPQNILEIGCGSGEILKTVSKGTGADLAVGVDISAAHLGFAQKRNSQTVYVQASAEHLPFQSKSFDLGLMVDLLEHVENVGLVLSEAARVCDWLMIKTPLEGCLEGRLTRRVLPSWKDRFGHVNFFGRKSLKRVLEQNGFVIIKEGLVYPPWELLGFSEGCLRSKVLILIRYLVRVLGKRIYSRIFPVWYVGLCRVKAVDKAIERSSY